VLVLFDVASVAKLASAFQLLLFGLVCIAVIVMRESKISTYKPGYKAPFYPWLQIGGILISFWLIIEMGILAIAYGIYDLSHIGEILSEEAESKFEIDPNIILNMVHDKNLFFHPISPGVHITYETHPEIVEPELFVLRFGPQAKLNVSTASEAHTLMFLIVPPKPVGLDLRLAGHLAEVVQSDNFELRWTTAKSERDMNEILMRDDHFLHGPVAQFPALAAQAGKTISNIELPASCLIALIEREGDIIVATADLELRATDEVAIIGEPVDLQALSAD